MMYTEQELTGIRQQQKRRWIALWVPVALMVAAIVVILVIRGMRQMPDKPAEIAVQVLTILIGVLLLGGWGMLIKPLHCYERHINNLLHGRTHVFEEGTFSAMEEDESLVDGVAYYALTLHCLDEKKKPYERLFYYDVQKPKPELQDGDPVRVVYHDRFVGAIEKL